MKTSSRWARGSDSRVTALTRRPSLAVLLLIVLLAGCTLAGTPDATPTAPPVATRGVATTPTTTAAGLGATATALPVVSPTAAALPPSKPGTTAPLVSPTAIASGAPQTPTPRGSQVLTLAGGIESPATLDPALIRDAASSFLARQVFSGLLKLDDALQPVPDLAAALPVVSADRLTYTFTLRQGLTFHDGTPLIARTVKESLERAGDPDLADGAGLTLPAATYLRDIKGMEARLAGQTTAVEGIRVTGALTLEIELTAPQTTFLVKLTHPVTTVVDSRQTGRRGWWKTPNGAGPFQLTEWRDGDRLVFSRWDRYHDGAPPLERIVWLVGANASQPLNLYEGGKIDIVELGADSIDRALAPSSSLHGELRVTPQLALTYLAFNVKEPPFDDLKVRQAFSRAVDRDKIVRVMFDGKVRGAAGLVPPPLLGSDLAQPTADRAAALAEARRLLAESRYGANVPRARLYAAGEGLGGTLREVYERDLGITIDVIAVPWNDFLLGLNAHEYPAYILSWLADYPDPQSFVETLFRGDSPENHTNYANPALDALLTRAATEPDAARRATLYRQAEQMVLDDAIVLPLYHATEYALVKPHVKGLTMTPLGLLSLDRVWIER